MPWRERSVVDERMKLIIAYQSGMQTVTELADEFGISRKTAYKILGRFDEGGVVGLVDRSRRPGNCPWATLEAVVKAVVACRRQHPRWGPKKLRRVLVKRHPTTAWPAVSTIGLILKRHGLTKGRRRRPPTIAVPRGPAVEARTPNGVWTTDYKGQFRTGDGAWCYPLTIMDRYSRYLLACTALRGPLLAETSAVFVQVFREVGLPQYIHSDNGEPFAGTGLAGLSRLQVLWLRLGIRPERGRPAHPEDNPEHERMHRTVKAETARPPAATRAAQERRFRWFRRTYNWERPHEALAFRVPGDLYQPSPRRYPRALPAVDYPAYFERRLVSTTGQIKWHTEEVFVSQVLQGQQVGLEEIDDDLWDIHFGPAVLARFDGRTHRLLGMHRLRYRDPDTDHVD